jgi:hypothetical protein
VITVVRTGPRALVDGGRPGLAAIGAVLGSFRSGGVRGGQALVGDRGVGLRGAAGRSAARTDAAIVVAVTGAPVSVTVDGEPAAGLVAWLPAGTCGWARHGRGCAPTSRWPVASCRRVRALSASGRCRCVPATGWRPPEPAPPASLLAGPRVRVRPAGPGAGALTSPARCCRYCRCFGPRFDHLARPAQLVGRWTVSPHSDRVGVRLDGGALDRTSPPRSSPGAWCGVPCRHPGGQLVVFGPTPHGGLSGDRGADARLVVGARAGQAGRAGAAGVALRGSARMPGRPAAPPAARPPPQPRQRADFSSTRSRGA